MKLNFDPNQEYQIDAVNAVVDLFEGHPLSDSDFEFSIQSQSAQTSINQIGIGNNIQISRETMLQNLKKIQTRNGIVQSEELLKMSYNIKKENDEKEEITTDFPNFSVEMETGTGKTYVYLRTIYELNKTYGFKKFVIVVPSVAIREGVLKNLEITHEHFQNLYNKVPVSYQVYDSKKVSSLKGFAIDNNIQILVINIDSFAKDENIINNQRDIIGVPIELIQLTTPIVIIDEPQNMETDIRKKAISNLNPAFTLRYSATHRNLYNLVYNLDPVRAYDLSLVKQIEVDSIVTENSFNDAFISLESVYSTKTRTNVKISIDINEKKEICRKVITVTVGDDLYEKSKHRDIYKNGYIIEEIDVANKMLTFANGIILTEGQTKGGMTDEIMKFQIEKTIEEHFKKCLSHKDKGIKVLSLFFIDRVANYRYYDDNGTSKKGKIARWFDELFTEIRQKEIYNGLIPYTLEEVNNGYFSQDNKGVLKDTQGESKADNDTYQLIMRDKERLLDVNEPLQFIFSHSALREGWDNPNVFQICTLNETKSELKKRQEIGRGLRLPVNKEGNRIFHKSTNILTVIANESYEDFANNLQREIEDECGVKFDKKRIKDKNNRITLKYRKGFELDPKFKEIWDKIKYRTKYSVSYDTEKLIANSAEVIKELPDIVKPQIRATKVGLEISKKGIGTKLVSEKNMIYDVSKPYLPDILSYIQSKTKLTRSTISRILNSSGKLNEVFINPQLFCDLVVNIINRKKYELMIDGIKYKKIGNTEYEMTLFEEKEIFRSDNDLKISDNNKTIFKDFIPLDSQVEYRFAKDCESSENVEFYFKLPDWFTIQTPIGKYNPDWALIFKNEKKIYFVAETKGTQDQEDLRKNESYKIKCGKAHFKEFEDVEYKVVTKVEELV